MPFITGFARPPGDFGESMHARSPTTTRPPGSNQTTRRSLFFVDSSGTRRSTNAWWKTPKSALADFDRATEIDPAYGEPYYYRARIWKRKGATERVVREYETLIERNPNHALGHQGLAWTLSTSEDPRVHNPRRAVKEATLACELTHWNDANCLDTLAAACADSGDFPVAVKWEDRAIALLQRFESPDPRSAVRIRQFAGPCISATSLTVTERSRHLFPSIPAGRRHAFAKMSRAD